MSGYKVFTAGEEALAAQVNDLLMSQSVARFTTAATRTAGIASPVLNQLTMLDSRIGIIQYWNGAGWVDLPGPFVQAGGQSMTVNAFGQATVTFPVPFAATPSSFIVQTPYPSAGVAMAVVGVQGTLTATGCNVQLVDAGGVPVASTTVGIWWIAVGVRA